jgi:hypothetical protein
MTPRLSSTVAAGPRAIALLVATLALVACAGGPAASDGVVSLASPTPVATGSTAPEASVDPEVAMEAFTTCMKEHGVDVFVSSAAIGENGGGTTGGGPVTNEHIVNGDPQAGGGKALDPAAMEEADRACRDLLPSGMVGDPDATMDPAVADQMLKFSKCMRDHGIDFPDPKFEGGGVSIALGENGSAPIDPTSDEFQAAQEACGSELPGGGPGFVSGPAIPVKP